MPDLMTHAFSGLILNKTLPLFIRERINFKDFVLFFTIGNILPDISSRVPMILFPEYTPFFNSFHTLLGSVVVCYIFSLYFDQTKRSVFFLSIFTGSVFHQLLDLSQKNIFGEGYMLFFPLKYEIKVGFINSEDSLYILPLLAVIVFFIYRKKKYVKGSRIDDI